MSPAGVFAILISVALVVTGQTLLKRGMTLVGPIDGPRAKRAGVLILDVAKRWQLYAGLAGYLLSAFTWVYALSLVTPSAAYPFLGLSYVGVAGAAVLFLGETLTIAQCVGIALVVSGVVMVAWVG
jgi:drug/metabolite transporter (DMT)-like permease